MTNTNKIINQTDTFVGTRIRQRRHQLGTSQTQLADALGLTFQQVQKYERGANRVSASKLLEIARTFGVPVAYFFEGLEDGSVAIDSTVNFFNIPGAGKLADSFSRLTPDGQKLVIGLSTKLAKTISQVQA